MFNRTPVHEIPDSPDQTAGPPRPEIEKCDIAAFLGGANDAKLPQKPLLNLNLGHQTEAEVTKL